MSLHWYVCISINTYCYEIYYITLETVWWALSNTSSIVWIYLAIHKILVNEAFIITNGLISWLFVVAFVHPTYVQIALIWGFPVQLLVCENWSTCYEDTSWMTFVTELFYLKGGPWIKNFSFFNLLCAWVTQAITNHAPIEEY